MSSAITPDDEAFVRSFHAGEIANRQFHHRDHLRLAWVLVSRHGLEQATTEITRMIRGFAIHHGAAERYNDTLTRFWILAVGLGIQRHPDLGFEDLLASEPHLLDKSLPFRHWTPELLNSPAAKREWVEGDLYPLPVPPHEGEGIY